MSQRSSISRLSSMKREWTDEPAATAISASAPVLSKSAREIKEVITIDSDDSEANGEAGADSWPASPKPNRTPSASAPQPAVSTSQLSPRSRRRLAMFGPVPATTTSTSNKRPLEDDWDPLVSSAPRKKLTVSNGGREATPRQKKKGPVELSTQQKKVIEMAMTGTNVFFTGSAGTGKSVLLRQLIKTLKAKHNTRADAVAVTASTGIAACNVAGQTLHSFAGIGLGVDPADKLAAKVRKNQKAMSRWMRTKVLIIDEISMVDGNLFDKLSKIGTILRRDQHPFGGIQIIATGDFFQLPPVSKGSNLAKFAFEAQMWKETIHRTVNLTQVFRQKDERFVDMLNEMRFGSLSTRSIARFKQLSRAVLYEDGIEPTELYPRREEVDTANSVRLRQLDSEEKHYTAHDSGAITDAQQLQKELSNLLAVPLLHLKVGCQVMLIKNLDEDLVNGSIGRVEGFYSEEDWPHIKNEFANENFDSEAAEATLIESRKTMLAKPKRQAEEERGGQVFPAVRFVLPGGDCIVRLITREQFQIEEPNGTVKASRVQLPLILSWAMSIHKSQGQTIERVKVDLRRIFEKGQAYVALSRATSLDSLQVLNFDERKVMVHEKVARFSHSLETLD